MRRIVILLAVVIRRQTGTDFVNLHEFNSVAFKKTAHPQCFQPSAGLHRTNIGADIGKPHSPNRDNGNLLGKNI
jgi:hypothetical protein